MSALQKARAGRGSVWLNAFLIVLLTVLLSGCNVIAPFLARPQMKPTGAFAAAAQGEAALAAAAQAGQMPGLPGTTLPVGDTLDPSTLQAPGGAPTPAQPSALQVDHPVTLAGRVQPPVPGQRYGIQAVSSEVVNGATVTLLGAGSQAIASGLTDSAGNFNLSLSGFVPASNGLYVLEAVKGLGPNAPGKDAMRFRTIVKWTGSDTTGWLSATNAAAGDPVINALTTAVALEIALDSNLSMDMAIGKVDASANALKASPAFPGHPDSEISALAQDLGNFLTNDVDPVGSVGAIKPTVTALSSSQGFPGSLVTITGNGFLPVAGGNTVKFNTTAAPIYLATATKLIAGVPAGASTGNVTVTTSRGGQSNGLPFNVTAGVSILVKTNSIIAPYYVAGAETVAQPGSRNVTVYPGTTQVVFTTGQAATFVVAADGAVDASLSNGALQGAAGEIQFKTTTLTVNPNGYAGNYILGGGFMPSAITGAGSALVLKGLLGYQLQAGTSHIFDMDSAGAVTPRGSWATGGSSAITLSNINLQVNANGFVGNWSINGVTASAQTGTVTLTVPKDSIGYVFNVMGTAFTFDVSGTGVVSTTSSYAAGGNQALTLNMVSVQVDAKGFTGMWSVGGVTNGWVRDNQTVVMMKNFNYRIAFWPGNSYVAFGLDSSGNISIQSAGGQATTNVVSSPSLGKLAFNVADVAYNAGGWKGYYGVLYGSTPGSWTWLSPTSGEANWVIGDKTYKLLQGMTNYYYLYFYPGTAEHYLNLNLASDGLVTAVGTGAKVTNSVASLGTRSVQLNTVMVPVSAGGWGGYWGLLYGDGPSRGWSWLTSATGDPNWVIGNRNFQLLKGLVDYYFFNFWPGANGNYHLILTVDGAGNVTEKATGGPVTVDALNSGAASIAINTADVSTDTNGWGGWYGMFYGASPAQGWTWLPTKTGDPNWVFGNKTYKMVRGISDYYFLWFYPGGTNYYLTLDLPGGSDNLGVGLAGTYSTAAALVATTNRTLKFNTLDVSVDTGSWTGYYGLLYGHGPQQGWSWLGDGTGNPNWVYGNKPYKLLKGLVDYYHFSYWPDPTKYRVVFNVDSGGIITRTGNGSNATQDALTVSGSMLTIPTRTLTVDEGNWEGYWGFLYGAGPSQGWTWLTSTDGSPNWIKKNPSQPNSTYTMVKGLVDYYFLYFWPGGANMYLNLNLDGSDNLTSKESGGPVSKETVTLASGASPKVTFNTTLTTVNPNGFRSYWGILYGISAQQGWTWTPATNGEAWWQFNNQTRQFYLLRGIEDYYFVYFWPGASDDYVQFKNDRATGALTYVGKGSRFGSGSISFSGTTATFNTQTVTVDSNGWKGYHGFFYGNGPQQGWTWHNATSGEWWVVGNGTWSLIKDTKGYFYHIFWPVGANYYRTIDVSSSGTISSPEGGAPVTSGVYSSVSGSTLTMNTGTFTLNNGNWGGHLGMLYGISPQQAWTWTLDSQGQYWAKYPSPTNRSYTLLRGIENYYYLAFWPWNPYVNLNYNSTGNTGCNQGGSGNATCAAVTVGVGSVSVNTHLYTVTSNRTSPRWVVHYGDSQSKDWMYDTSDIQDWISASSRQWYMVPGLSNYYWHVVEGQLGGGSFSTADNGTPTPNAQTVNGTYFTVTRN